MATPKTIHNTPIHTPKIRSLGRALYSLVCSWGIGPSVSLYKYAAVSARTTMTTPIIVRRIPKVCLLIMSLTYCRYEYKL